MHYSIFWRQAVPLIAGFVGAAAWAQDTSPTTVTAAYTVQTDDNLFRLPDGVSTHPERSDRIGISTLGLLFHTVQGLQQVDLDASLVNYQYQNNVGLGYTARNYAAAWHWAVTSRMRGNLTGNQQERPNGSAGDTAPNQQTQTSYRADAEYEVDGPWHVLAGASKDKVSNQNAVTAGQDYSSSAVDTGIRYDHASGSFAKISVRAADGTYLNALAPPTSAIDSKFQQIENVLNLHWAVSSASSADLNATAFRRSHPVYVQRDFSGLNLGGNLNWALSAKTTLSLGFLHDLAAYATINSNYSESDRLSWGWNWQASAKTQLRVRQELVQISYHGSPFGIPESTRQDNTRDTSLSLAWQPRTQWQISTALHQVSRSTNVPGLDYISNQLSVSGQFNY